MITTATLSQTYLKEQAGDVIQKVLIDRVLNDIGIDPKQSKWLHFGQIYQRPEQERLDFLKQVADEVE